MSAKKTIENKQGNNVPKHNPEELYTLAKIIIIGSFLIMIIVIGLVFAFGAGNQASQTVMTAILPLLGAWVGAVIAFYFSSKNLDSATKNIKDLYSGLSGQEKLKLVPTKDKMIPKEKMFYKKNSDDTKLLLGKMLSDLDKTQKGNRIPVLNDNDHPRYVIHRSIIDNFIAKKAVEESGKATDVKTLSGTIKNQTLSDLVEKNPNLKYSAGVIREESTLADVKKLMDALGKNCQDIFVTKTGSYNEPVVGWVTNIIIDENSVVGN